MKQPKLSNGTTGFYNDANEWGCTGSQMGRRNVIPEDSKVTVKLHMNRLCFVDSDYDTGDAYWGGPANVYRAYDDVFFACQVFVRADSREQAKAKVREILQNAKFYQ